MFHPQRDAPCFPQVHNLAVQEFGALDVVTATLHKIKRWQVLGTLLQVQAINKDGHN